MEIKVLGPGCSKCKTTYNVIEKFIKDNNIDAKLIKVDENLDNFWDYDTKICRLVGLWHLRIGCCHLIRDCS